MEFQVGICIDRDDPDGLRRIRIRTDDILDKTDWVLPLLGGHMNHAVPQVGDQVILLASNSHYDLMFYVPGPTKQFGGNTVGDRQEKVISIKESIEFDLEGKVNLKLDGENDEAQLEASRVVIGTDESTEFIVMSAKLADWLTNTLILWLSTHNHPTGVGPSGPPIPPAPTVTEAQIASSKHEVEP